jgi:hypothetical protein
VKSRRRAQLRKVTKGLFYHGTVFVLAFVMLYPLLWLFTSSFKPPDEIWTDVLALWAKNPTLQNYIVGWRGLGFITFTTFYKNTFFYAGAATIIQVFASAWVGYGFSRLRFVGRRFWFVCMMISLMLPGQVTLIPAYIMFARLGWINTFYPLLVHPGTADRAGRSGGDRRLWQGRHILQNYPAAHQAGAGHGGHLYVLLDMERLYGASDLLEQAPALHHIGGTEDVYRSRQRKQLGGSLCHVGPIVGTRACRVRPLPKTHRRRDRHDRPAWLTRF